MTELIYLNGLLVPRSEARISVFDHGFLYGYALFETMRAYHGNIFLVERHIKRLLEGARAIGLGPGLKGIDIRQACTDALNANGLKDARVRMTVTGGEADAFPWEGKGGTPNIVITARLLHPFPPEKYAGGYKIGITSVRRCALSTISQIKSVNYLPNVLSRMEAAKYSLDEALLLNDRGFIAEGGNSNVFFIRGSTLLTPSLDSGILPGITRELVIELAEVLGINVIEGEISLADLAGFDEAFLTSSIIEIMPVVAVRLESGKSVTIGDGRQGKITKRLMMAYRERVEKETLNSGL